MELKDIVVKNRSYRRYNQAVKLSDDKLYSWLDMVRLTPSARNLQSLKYAVVCDEARNFEIFAQLKWAGYLTDWNPSLSESPAAYVVFCNDKQLSVATPQIDLGIQAQTLLMAAVSEGYGGCILLAFNKIEVARILNLPSYIDPVLVVALGAPTEVCITEDIAPTLEPTTTDNIKYYRDENQIHHVPKRSLNELIITL